jgi:hypothetical protein
MVCKNCHCRGLLRRWLQGRRAGRFLRLAKIARMLVRFNHVASIIVNTDLSAIGNKRDLGLMGRRIHKMSPD